MVVVQVRRGRDKKVHASRFEVRVAVKERPLENPPVLSPSRIAGIAIPSGIIRHLENLAHHRLGYVVVVYIRPPNGRLSAQAWFVGVVRIVDHRRRERQAVDVGDSGLSVCDEIPDQQHLLLDLRAVKWRPRAE